MVKENKPGRKGPPPRPGKEIVMSSGVKSAGFGKTKKREPK